jgi:putative DNA primase/helicase
LVKGGFYAASTDVDEIKSWWGQWPSAAIGLRTGQEPGVFAVDIDPRNGGDVSLELLEDCHGQLPETVESQTGGGGRHLLFAWPGRSVPCSVGKVGAGIDIKGDGGYVILPPSDHKSGREYCWLFGQEPGECGIAEAPDWLMEMIEQESPTGPVASGEPVASDEIPQGCRNKVLASQAGHMRQIGMTSEEIAPALQAINLHRCKPPLEAAEVDRIAASIGRYDPDTSRQAQVECWPERYLGDGCDWPDPQPLPEDLPPVKPFDPVLLPSTLRGWIVDIAERMQCPPDFPAVSAMVALSGILGRKIVIRPKQKDNWIVFPNLWGIPIGRPSLMKSPPMKETLLPIRRMTAEALEKYEKEVAEFLLAQDLHDISTKLAKNRIAKAMKAGDDSEEFQAQFADLQPPEQPARKRYTVNDATIEALGEILSANPNGVIVERDELIGLLKSLERPGQEGARAFYLEGWTGDGSCEVDRIGRGNVRIDGICLSILGTIQPGPLGTYLGEALRGGTGDDGLMQRFQLAVWPDDPGPWKVVDRLPDAKARDVAYEVYRRFDDLPAAKIGALPDAFDSNTIPFLRFAPDAQERFYDWMTTRENHLRSGKEHPAIESHLTKYRKLIPAVSLITHLADGREGPVALASLEAAIGWGDYLESHARRIYSCGIDPAIAHARALVQRIQSGDVTDGFTVRDVYYGRHWSMLADAAEVQLAVDELVELGWLRVEEVPTSGRPTKRHRINPKAMAMTS